MKVVGFMVALVLVACAHPLRGANPSVGIQLPRDHAAHDDAQTEWWHFHGHLVDESGERFDWFLAFVRQHTDLDRVALIPARWFVDPFDVAYFSITSRAAGEIHVREKHAFPDTWAASADTERLRLTHDSWKAEMRPDGTVTVTAATRRARLELDLTALKPPALLGRRGFVEIPPVSSHYYYSVPRMRAAGTVVIDGRERRVDGTAWLKHEWGYLYAEHIAGWVWFGAQLSSGHELEIALIFDHDWTMVDGSFAVVEERDGRVTHLDLDQVEIRQLGETWRSPRTDTVYPTAWLIEIPGRGGVILKAPTADQEMVVFPANLWAGSLEVSGTFDDADVSGDCFAEIVGLDRPWGRSLLRTGRPR